MNKRHASPSSSVEEILARLREHSDALAVEPASAPSLSALLAQCQQAQETLLDTSPSIRAIHHFACTGGTLISKCLAVLPNCILLNEIDPLSTMHLQQRPTPFLPTDLISGLRTGVRDVSQDTLVTLFQSELAALFKYTSAQGYDLVIRCHSHTQYCTESSPESRPRMHDILGAVARVRGIVTVRHPLDSFLSLTSNGWTSFSPFTLDEYARRCLLFLDDHEGIPLYRYEDFLEHPHQLMQQMSDTLDLPYWSDFDTVLSLIKLSGDSGRTGLSIAPRPRREVPDDVEKSRGSAPRYRTLCSRLDYPV